MPAPEGLIGLEAALLDLPFNHPEPIFRPRRKGDLFPQGGFWVDEFQKSGSELTTQAPTTLYSF